MMITQEQAIPKAQRRRAGGAARERVSAWVAERDWRHLARDRLQPAGMRWRTPGGSADAGLACHVPRRLGRIPAIPRQAAAPPTLRMPANYAVTVEARRMAKARYSLARDNPGRANVG
jgi:hypothetical protein